MKDLVEAALESIDGRDPEPVDDGPVADEFGPPTCALVGCGPAGVDRIENLEERTETETIMPRPDAGPTGADVSVPLSLEQNTSLNEGSSTGYADSELDLDDAVLDADIVAVTTHLGEPDAGWLAESVCRQLSADQTVLAVPSVPQEGLTDASRAALLELIDAAGTTIPYDLARIEDAFCRTSPMGDEPLARATALIAELLEDIFAAFRGSIAAPCLRQQVLYELFDSDGVAVLYWGWGTRSDDPEALIHDAAAHRLCDGNRETTSGGFGFVRFGPEFTLEEFESIRAHSYDLLCPDGVSEKRWILCGDTSPGLSGDYRVMLLLTGIAPESLPFR